MELTLLGTGVCAPNIKRAPSGYFLSIGPSRFLIDPGPGAMQRAITNGHDPYDIDAIVLTHMHLDHSADIMPYLFNYKNSGKPEEKRDVNIIAPVGFLDMYQKLLDVYGKWTLSPDYNVVIEEMNDTTIESKGVIIRALPMAHGAGAQGYRFEKPGGGAFLFSGDTQYCEELVTLATGAKLLLVECSFPDDMKIEGHMTPSEVAQVGKESGVKRIVLTHFYPELDGRTAVEQVEKAGYEGEVIAGEDGMRIDI